jgi:hypothetical protein
MISNGKRARIQAFGRNGGPRSILRAKHPGAYIERPGTFGGKTRAQKQAAHKANGGHV